MGPRIQKVTLVNNYGQVNAGNRYNLSPFSVSKSYNGSGGASTGRIVNGQRTDEELQAAAPMATDISLEDNPVEEA